MSKKNKGLGVGALLSGINTNIDAEDKKELVSQLSNTATEIPLAYIEPNPFNPRVEFDAEALSELAESIKIHGLIQPITVRHLGGDKFQLISGERRWRASKMAGLEAVPAYVRIADDDAMLELALIENIQRQDLNAIEIATTYDRLMEELKLTHDTLSKRVGKKRSTVSNYLRLLKLPANIQAAIKAEELTMGHARALVNIEDIAVQAIISKEVIDKGLSVRQVEHYAKLVSKALPEVLSGLKSTAISLQHVDLIGGISDIVLQLTVYKEMIKRNLTVADTEKLIEEYSKSNQNRNTPPPAKTPKLALPYQRVQDELKSHLSAKVQLKVDEKGRGQITINFEDEDDLNRILEKINA